MLRRLQTLLLAALAAVALILSVIGAYGVIHQSVAAETSPLDPLIYGTVTVLLLRVTLSRAWCRDAAPLGSIRWLHYVARSEELTATL